MGMICYFATGDLSKSMTSMYELYLKYGIELQLSFASVPLDSVGSSTPVISALCFGRFEKPSSTNFASTNFAQVHQFSRSVFGSSACVCGTAIPKSLQHTRLFSLGRRVFHARLVDYRIQRT